jgi:excisionase family DNA binding protein
MTSKAIQEIEQFQNFIKETVKEVNVNQKLTLTIEEAAKCSGIGRDKLLELVHNPNSDFPYFKVGTKFLINREMLKEWLRKVSEERRVL